MKSRILGAVLGALILFGLGLYALMGCVTARARYRSFSPGGRYSAQTSDPYFTWYWSGWADGTLTVTNLATRKATSLRVEGLNLAPWMLSWSRGEQPSLAVVHLRGAQRVLLEGETLEYGDRGTTRLLVYSTRDGRARDITLTGESRFLLPHWSPDGRALALWSRDEPGPVYLWKEGREEAEALGPWAAPCSKLCWLADGGLLAVAMAKDERSRMYVSAREDLPRFEEVTAQFPPLNRVVQLFQSPAFPDIFYVLDRSAGSRMPVYSWMLVRRGERAPLKVWPESLHVLPGFTEGGRALLFARWDFDKERRRWNNRQFTRVSLPDLTETPILQGFRNQPYGDLTADPVGAWYGLEVDRPTPLSWLTRQGATFLYDEGRFKETPLRFTRDTDDWLEEPGHSRLAVERIGGFFPSISLLEPVSGHEERVPASYAWGALFAQEMAPFWLSLLGFLLNGALFAVLFYGRSHSEGARPLGFLFFCLAWTCVAMEAPGISFVIFESWGEAYGAGFILALIAALLVFVPSAAAIPYAAQRFATTFPHPNPYREGYPGRVKALGAVTFLLPLLAALLPILYLVSRVLHRASSPFQEEQAIRSAEEGVGAAYVAAQAAAAALGVAGVVVLVMAIVAVVNNYRSAPDQKIKGQLKYVALGLSCFLLWGIIGGMFWNFLRGLFTFFGVPIGPNLVRRLPASFIDYDFPLVYLGLLMVIPAAFCGYALLSKELLDLSFVIRRTVKYAVLVAVLGALFVGIVAGLGVLLPSALGANSPVAAALASVVTVLAFQPVRRRVQDWVDKRFDRARYDARRTLSDLTARFATMGSPEQIRATLESAARDVLRVGQCRTLFFREGKIPRGRTGVSALQDDVAGSGQPGQAADLKDIDLKDLRDALAVEEPWIRLVVPVAHGNEAYAVLALGEKLSQEKYSAEDREFLKILTDGAGLALKNLTLVREAAKAEIYERDLEAAREVQTRYFPKELPAIPGFALAASNEPARIVGGDYYDALDLGDGRFAIVLADVSGKGMPAALRVAEVRTFLHTALPRNDAPGEILAQMNRHLCASGAANEFTTLFLGILEPEENRLVYANAGHVPPLLKNRAGETTTLPPSGSLPLGIVPTESYASAEVELEAGSLLVLMSDGLPERMDPEGHLLGFDAVEGALAGCPPDSTPQEVAETLRGLGESFARGEPAEDDTTIVILGRADGT